MEAREFRADFEARDREFLRRIAEEQLAGAKRKVRRERVFQGRSDMVRRLDLARKWLRRGDGLTRAALAAQLRPADLDKLLWRQLGGGC